MTVAVTRLRFDLFILDSRERILSRDGAAIDLSARYFDALALMVREPGALISKDRFLAEVWRGIPVTDEALTQCIKTLRRALGDDVGAPRFIATVPKHGYRFIALVESDAGEANALLPQPVVAPAASPWREALVLAGAGTVGGGIAGMIGGLIYGFAVAPPAQLASGSGTGAASTLLVLTSVTLLVALIGGAGVAGGIAIAGRIAGAPWRWAALGGAAGGLVVGAVTKLLGLDAFALLLGQSPGDITGALEGLALGGAVGLGGWAAQRIGGGVRCGALVAAAISGAAGLLIVLAGGRLMAGSLDLLAASMPQSRLSLARIGALFGEQGLGPISQLVTGALEAALFGAGVIAAMLLAGRKP